MSGIPFSYFGYFYGGPEGTVQVITYTGRNLVSQFRPDLEDFLNGFRLTHAADAGPEVDGVGQFGPALNFDTKGVEFGMWTRTFLAQLKRNWMIPRSALAQKGHVVLTLTIHRDGRITDLNILSPCAVEPFNTAAYNALADSNPTLPLPSDYPAEAAAFVITLYYNERPK